MPKNSPQAVASTELGNVPFNKTTLASIVLSHLPVAWRTQYALTHKLVPESPRAILNDLENIEKLFAEKANEAARANKAKVAAATKADERVPRKGKRTGGGPDRGAPKKGRTDKYFSWKIGKNAVYNFPLVSPGMLKLWKNYFSESLFLTYRLYFKRRSM